MKLWKNLQSTSKNYLPENQLSSEGIATKLGGLNLPKLQGVHKLALSKPFTNKGIENAIFQQGPFKALGMVRMDGKPGAFYQEFWDITGLATIQVVKAFLESGNLSREFNKTMITLILKIEHQVWSHNFD